MSSRSTPTIIALLILLGSAVAGAASVAPPEPVSPGGAAESAAIAGACPTFSWSGTDRKAPLELMVFRPSRGDEQPEILIQEKLAGGARTWTPKLSQCLSWGEEYGWFLRRSGEKPGPWSEARYFRLPEAPTEAQAARAANVLKRYLDAQGESATADGLTAGPAALVGASPDEAGEREASRPTTAEGRDVPNDMDCTTGTPRTVDGGNVGQWTGIAVRNDGNPIISYSADGSLKAFDCDDAACSSRTIRTLDDGGGNNVGHYARVAVRDDGTPIFSHYDSIDDDLKVFECDDAACSSGNADIADGGSDNVGRFTDIAVRDNGFPIISYYDDTNTRLKVFDCNSSTCLSGVERSLDDGVDGFLNRYRQVHGYCRARKWPSHRQLPG